MTQISYRFPEPRQNAMSVPDGARSGQPSKSLPSVSFFRSLPSGLMVTIVATAMRPPSPRAGAPSAAAVGDGAVVAVGVGLVGAVGVELEHPTRANAARPTPTMPIRMKFLQKRTW